VQRGLQVHQDQEVELKDQRVRQVRLVQLDLQVQRVLRGLPVRQEVQE
jgi:hypothetical protein